jgi:hypothetical protein
MSLNLNLTQTPSNANAIEVPINDATGELDAALTDILTTDITSSNADTLTNDEFRRYQFQQIDPDGVDPATGPITLTVPAIKRGSFGVFNNTAFTVTVTISGQSKTAPVIPAGEHWLLMCDGTDVWPQDDATADGLLVKRTVRATYDFAAEGGAVSTIGLGVTLPDNAIITRSWYEVITTLTSSGDNATIAIGLPTDDVGGIVAAIAIDAPGDPWDIGLHETIQTGMVSNFTTKTTAAREISIDIAVEAVTAGKFIVFCEYVVTE